jgi:cyclophilin family peptidyl-prolyl cis-trans isomerase
MSTKYVTLETNRGTIVAELFDRDCPGTVENFERLANSGFYDGVTFHRVQQNVLAETGIRCHGISPQTTRAWAPVGRAT